MTRCHQPCGRRIGGDHERESVMPHTALVDVVSAIDIQTGTVVSRVILRDDRIEVTVSASTSERA